MTDNIHTLRQNADDINAKQVCDSRQESGQKSVNLFYLTERCDLACDYCYEQKCRKGLDSFKDTTEEEIVVFIKEMAERESNCTSVVRVFGGEPLLRMDLLEFFIRACHEIKPSSFAKDKPSFGVAINLITNGVALASMKNVEELQGIMGLAQKYAISISLDISYDGSGQDRRVFAANGRSSRDAVEKALNNLTKADVPFGISYTVHKTNHHDVVADCIRLCERYSNVLSNIKIGFAFKELAPIYGEEIIKENMVLKHLTPYMQELYTQYNIPICYDMVCHLCGKCVKAETTLNIGTPGGKIFKSALYKEEDWDYFSESNTMR